MGFIEDIAKVSEQVRKNAEHVVGEQATKMALNLVVSAAVSVSEEKEFCHHTICRRCKVSFA